jgi:hypothetical protein
MTKGERDVTKKGGEVSYKDLGEMDHEMLQGKGEKLVTKIWMRWIMMDIEE